MSACPSANEFGVRSNPVCVDEVDTSRFSNISVDLTSTSSISETSSTVAVCQMCCVCMCEWGGEG